MPKGRILAVDDQAYFRDLLKGMLVEEGFEVETASGGEEALEYLQHAAFDVVLTDLVMPDMDGNELVHRVKERDPEQDVVVVTGVVDVKTAVDSMKLGASEYLLKPFDRDTLANTLDGVLQRRRLRIEHARLLSENIEYMGERTLIERATALFSILDVDALGDRIVEGLCIETGAQGGVLWVADDPERSGLALASVRGLVRMDEELERVGPEDIPVEFARGTARSALIEPGDGTADSESALYLALRDDSQIIGVLRLTDKLGVEGFDSVDRSCAELFSGFGQTALRNALRFRALERNASGGAADGVYSLESFRDVVRNEVEKSSRHGRCFSLLKLCVDFRHAGRDDERLDAQRRWTEAVIEQLLVLKRSSDLLATDGRGEFMALLPETDSLGAALLKKRTVEALAASDQLADHGSQERFTVEAAVASYPSDGARLESLDRLLDQRLAEEHGSLLSKLALANKPLTECLKLLLERGIDAPPALAAKIARFVLAEVSRRPANRALISAAPGAILADVAAGVEALGAHSQGTEAALVANDIEPESGSRAVGFLTNRGRGVLAPFLIYLGEGTAYALVCEDAPGRDRARLFQTADRSLVEHLALRTQAIQATGEAA